MTLAAARRFILRVSEDDELRRSLNAVPSQEDLTKLLAAAVGEFSLEVFDEVIRSFQVRCRTEVQAEELEDLRRWWHCLVASVNRGP